MKWSIHAAVVLRVPRFASMRTMLICGIRSIVLLRSMSPDRMSVATKPAIIPFSAFPIIRPDSTFLFDHLVGKSEQFFRNFDTNRVRGFEVDHELENQRQEKMMASDDKKIKTNSAPENEAPPEKKSTSGAEPSKADGGELAAASPSGYSRGEGQKPVSKAYRDNWNVIFAKKKKR